jgi:predicted ATPase/DNA-binding SARP family transcriptional activator
VHDLSITLFGTPQIQRGNEQISIQRRKDLALLIYLVSTSQPQSRDTLATLLWQDQTQTEARSNLRKSLSRLKSLLGEGSLVVSQNQIGLNPSLSIKLDTDEFNSSINQFRQHGHVKKDDGLYLCEECEKTLEDAARLYCADFLQGFSIPDSPAFDEWQFFQSESLRQNLAEALEHLTLQFAVTAKYSTAIEYCRRWLSLDRLHEPPHRQLMLLYALSGQHAAAIRQFEECVRILKNELNAEPEAETVRLSEAIQKKKIHQVLETWGRASSTTVIGQASSPLQPAQKTIHNLPIHRDPFVGRDKELTEIFELLNESSCRLLTLLGPGGSGKTRLAVQLASMLNTSSTLTFRDGIAFIPLAPVTDLSSLVGTIAEGLQISGYVQGADDRQKLLDHLRGRQMLLVIDNLEHLLATESIKLMSDILDVAPLNKILITSRERLNIRDESIFRVEGLETPTDGSYLFTPRLDSVLSAFSALQLFEQCARRIHPSFKITQENYHDIAQICRNVQGMPLAIELAASWLEVFTPEEISAEVNRSLDFLQSNWRDVPDRQRSLRAVFDSSWQLLDRQMRPIVKALSVFRGSFSREAAQAVSGASAKALLNLTNKSWIQHLSNGRYQIHELLKQFVYEKLSRETSILEQVRKQYCNFYAGYTHSLWETMKGSNQRGAYAGMEIEFENIHTAWLWLVAQNRYELAVQRMLPILLHYAETWGKTLELLAMLDTAIESFDGSRKDRDQVKTEIILRTARGTFFHDGLSVRYSDNDSIFPIDLKNIREAWKLAKTSMELEEIGFWGILLSFIYARFINLKDGVREIKKMIPHFEREHQQWELASAYLHLIKLMILKSKNDNDQMHILSTYLSRATNIFEALGDQINAGYIQSLWGEFKYMQRDIEGAIDQWQAARATFLSVDEWGTATSMLWQLCTAYLEVGDFSRAFGCCREMANVYMQHGARQLAVSALSKESYEKSRHGDLADALQIRQKCIDIIHETGPEYQFAWNYWEMGELVRLSGDLVGAADWFERSRKIFDKNQDSIGQSFYFRGMGDLAIAREDFRSARLHFSESVKLARAGNHIWTIAYSMNGLGRAELGLGHRALAEKHIVEALKIAARSRDPGITLVALYIYAELLKKKEQLEKAIQTTTLVCNHFATWHETRKQATELQASLRKASSRSRFLKAEEKGSSTDLWKLVDGIVKQQSLR